MHRKSPFEMELIELVFFFQVAVWNEAGEAKVNDLEMSLSREVNTLTSGNDLDGLPKEQPAIHTRKQAEIYIAKQVRSPINIINRPLFIRL